MNKHILKQHNVTMPKKLDKNILVYKISLQTRKKICKDNAMISRINYYKNHEWIVHEKLPIKVDNTTLLELYDMTFEELLTKILNVGISPSLQYPAVIAVPS